MVFYRGWARGFPRKIMCSLFSLTFGISAVCENLATFGKTQFAPLLCLVLLKPNKGNYENVFARLVDCVKILQVVGRGFLPRLGWRFST